MFWRRKSEEDAVKCPLCNSEVDESDVECPLCFYELDRSPRHQSLNITTGEEGELIDLLGAENEPEEEISILEAEDVIDLSAEDPLVHVSQDEEEFISIPADQAPSFISSRMVPTGVAETAAEPEQDISDEEEEEFDLGGISIPAPPDSSEVEYEAVEEIQEPSTDEPSVEDVEQEDEVVEEQSEPQTELPTPPAPSAEGEAAEPLQPSELPAAPLPPPSEAAIPSEPPAPPLPLPPPPLPQASAPPKPDQPLPLPPPPMPTLPPLDLPSPYLAPPPPTAPAAPQNGNLAEGCMWPWDEADPWDARDLRRELLESMSAAKAGQVAKAAEILDRIGPHLGDNIELLFHVGVLLKRLGREYDLVQLLMKAKARHPDDQDVSNAASRLG